MRKFNWSILLLAIAAVVFVGTQWRIGDRQVEVEKAQADIQRAVQANCVVVSVLLINRADRDEAIKLFEPIRRQNPEQFDKLVKRAEKGDKRLDQVQDDLACKIAPKRTAAKRQTPTGVMVWPPPPIF